MGDRLKWDRPRFTPHQSYGVARAWRFTFGVYKGHPIERPPTSYLIWLRHNTPNLDIARRCSEEIERRKAIAHATK